MFKRLKNRFLHDEEGSGLIIALMTLMVLSVLGVSLGTITISGYKMSDTNRDSSSAYYIAEAGANMAYEEMVELVNEAYPISTSKESFFLLLEKKINEKINGNKYTDFAKQFGESPLALIELDGLTGDNPRTVKVLSTGKVGNNTRLVEKKVDITWHDKNTGISFPPIPLNAAIVVKNKLELTGGASIHGDVHIDSLSSEAIYIDGGASIYNGATFHHPSANGNSLFRLPDHYGRKDQLIINSRAAPLPWEQYENISNQFPEIPIFPYISNKSISDTRGHNHHQVQRNGDLRINNYLANGYPFNKENNYNNVSIRTMTITENNRLKINTNGKDLSIVVEHFDISNGHIDIVGNGSVTFYVTDKISFGSGSTINKDGRENQVKIYYAGSHSVNMGGSQHLNGSIFTKRSSIDIGSGASVKGVIVVGGNSVKFSGGTHSNTFLIAPKANLIVEGGATISGIVISEKAVLSGGTKIEYKAYDFNKFPFTISNSRPEPGESDLISSQPTIEAR
ncbi:pilus assembly PilX family protein [Alkalibacterium sp. MB6]|uniref:pilus assembly PilX family protein n=1 Tax=Alkalibacterium sp. MB6 TaxID=2081965 RepID=UPI001379C4B9|nr:pilus assembly PilX N-terminal domain-containing protein [Alkalibacterium sp. MB6]